MGVLPPRPRSRHLSIGVERLTQIQCHSFRCILHQFAPVPGLRGFQSPCRENRLNTPSFNPRSHGPSSRIRPLDQNVNHLPVFLPWSSKRFTSSTHRNRSLRYPILRMMRPRHFPSQMKTPRPRLRVFHSPTESSPPQCPGHPTRVPHPAAHPVSMAEFSVEHRSNPTGSLDHPFGPRS